MKRMPEGTEQRAVLRWGMRRMLFITFAMVCSMLAVALYTDTLIVFPSTHLLRLLHSSSVLSRRSSLAPSSTESISSSSPPQISSSASLMQRTEMAPSSSSSLMQRTDMALSALSASTSSSSLSTTAQKTPPSAASIGCDYASGKWVKSEKKALYSGESCKKWLSAMWACRLMPARTNFHYENFRWQPNGCNLPEFDSKQFLARLRNKVMVFVGDSIGRQQYQSLMCMLTGGDDKYLVKDVSKNYGLVKKPGAIRADGTAQVFIRTNTTIIYYWSASLCELQPINNSDPNTEYAMHLDRPAKFLQNYLKVMDVLILNTGHHWNRGKLEANKWVMHVNGTTVTSRRYQRAISTARELTIHKVVAWLHKQKEFNRTKAEIYFRSLSPRHFFDGEWNSGGRCDDDFIPSLQQNITRPGSDLVVKRAISATSLHLLDITHVSQFRYDAHISKYRPNQSGQDCLHWCLPGVPDVWNELLYADIISRGMKSRYSTAGTQ